MKDGGALFHQPLFIYMYAFGPRGATAKFFKKKKLWILCPKHLPDAETESDGNWDQYPSLRVPANQE